MQVLECLGDLRDRAMLTVAEGANEGNHIQTKLAMRQSPGALFLGTNRLMVVCTGRVGAAHDGDGQAGDILKGGDGALGLVEVPQAATTGRTLSTDGQQADSFCDWWAFRSACHNHPPRHTYLFSYPIF